MARSTSAMRVTREDAEKLPTQDDSRPVTAASSRMMLNNCQRCGRYKYVLCLVGGPFAYLCGRCNRELKAEGQ